ncbi:MAG: WD40 repeat domain-containing protein [Pirellulaceae bacterium]
MTSLLPVTCRRLTLVGLLLASAAVGRLDADDDVRLIAGPPIVLAPPPINKSIGNPVYCLAFAGDGDALVTGAASGALVWDVPSGKLRQTLEVDQRGVDALALDPRSTVLAIGGASGVIQVFDAKTFKLLHTLGSTTGATPGAVSGAVCGLSISPDGRQLASVSSSGWQEGGGEEEADEPFGVTLWDLAAGRKQKEIAHPAPTFGATALAFLPEGKQLVTAQDRTLRVVDVEAGKTVETVELPQLPRTLGALALHADGRRLVTGAFEPMLRLWDVGGWKQVGGWDAHDREPPPRRGVSAVGFSPDGAYVLSGGMDGMVCVWDASNGRRLLELDGRGEVSARWITGVAMTADNGWLAASHFGGTATLWRITAEK